MDHQRHACILLCSGAALLSTGWAQPETFPTQFTRMSLAKTTRFGTSACTTISFRILPQEGYMPLALTTPEKLTATDSTGKILPCCRVDLFHNMTGASSKNTEENYTVSMAFYLNTLPDVNATSISLKGNIPVLAAREKQILPPQSIMLDGKAVSIPLPETGEPDGKKQCLTVTATTCTYFRPQTGCTWWALTITGDTHVLFHSLTLKNRQGEKLNSQVYDSPPYTQQVHDHQRKVCLYYAIPEQEKDALIQITCLRGEKTTTIPLNQDIGLGGAKAQSATSPER